MFGQHACSSTRSMSPRESASSPKSGPSDSWAEDFPFEGDIGAVGIFLARHHRSGEQRPFGYYRITRLSDGQAVGGVGFKGRPDDGCVEIGYGLAPPAVTATPQRRSSPCSLATDRDCPGWSPTPPWTTSPRNGPLSGPDSASWAPTTRGPSAGNEALLKAGHRPGSPCTVPGTI